MTKSWVERSAAEVEKKPRLLLVDDCVPELQRLAKLMEERGFEVIKVQIQGSNAASTETGIIPLEWIDDISRYAVDPKNRVDAVVTDLRIGQFYFGALVVEGLRKSGFNGPIAAHSNEPRSQSQFQRLGAIDVFKKSDPDKTAAALHQALNAKGQGVVI